MLWAKCCVHVSYLVETGEPVKIGWEDGCSQGQGDSGDVGNSYSGVA